jgi:hypothetical protein
MHRISRVFALVLLITIAASLAGAEAHELSTMHAQPPAGCHSHGHQAPSPVPVSYRCCVSGHQRAIPGSAYSYGPLVAQGSSCLATSPAPMLVLRRDSVESVHPSASPPTATPLRI